MHFQTQAAAVARVRVAYRDQAILPSSGEARSFFRHAVRVITERLMERRAFADGAVNQIGIGGIAESEHVRLDGNQQVGGRVRKLPQHGLAADDYDFTRTGNANGRTNDVFKLRSLPGGTVA